MMPPFRPGTWEYALVDFEDNGATKYTDDKAWTDYQGAVNELDRMGELGWELVCVEGCRA